MDYKKDFPIFSAQPNLVYLDSAATSQKPQAFLDAEKYYYEKQNSNIHRSAHFLAEEATIAYESTRQSVADFIGAKVKHEIVFTRNATESVNLVARSYGDAFLKKGDRVLLTKMEHHSNLVPWLQLKERVGIEIDYLEVDDDGYLIVDDSKFDASLKFVSITGMSNSLGTINPIKQIAKKAHEVGAIIFVDACQLAVHSAIGVQDMDVDFLAFSAHKLYGPTGVGVLYGKMEHLKKMPAFMGGGEMIHEVFTQAYSAGDVPSKFEAGTPNIAGVISFKAALDYVNEIGFDKISKIEESLTAYALKKLNSLPFLKIVGPQTLRDRGSVISFVIDGVHPHDIAEGLSNEKIAIRAGHHCCQVLMDELGLPATARISLSFYNTESDVDRAVEALKEVYAYFN